jgi:hypothetical protein
MKNSQLSRKEKNNSQQPLKANKLVSIKKSTGGKTKEVSAITNGEGIGSPASSKHFPADTLLSRKETIEKGCGESVDVDVRIGEKICGQYYKYMFSQKTLVLCPTCQARLDERIRAEQDFLKMLKKLKIGKAIATEDKCYNTGLDFAIEELKSTIKETKE